MAKKKTKKPARKKGGKKKGFTLIELLIVIAIIGILAAVVLASLSSARQRARMANFKAQASSVHAAAIIYCDKSDAQPSIPGGVIEWPDNSTGRISSVLTCNQTIHEFSGGQAESYSTSTGSNCTANFNQTGIQWGSDC